MRGDQTYRGQTLVPHLCATGDFPSSDRLRGLRSVDLVSSLTRGFSPLTFTCVFATCAALVRPATVCISLENWVKAWSRFLLCCKLVIWTGEILLQSVPDHKTINNTFFFSVGVAGAHRGVGLRVAVESRVVALVISLLPRSPLVSLHSPVLMIAEKVPIWPEGELLVQLFCPLLGRSWGRLRTW